MTTERFLEFDMMIIREQLNIKFILISLGEPPLPPRSDAPAVALLGFAGGEFLPLRRSKGAAFPFLLTLDGPPLLPRVAL